MVFTTSFAQAAVSADGHDHAQVAATSHHDCMQNDNDKANADGCHDSACCHAMSSSAVISSTVPQQHPLHTFFQPTLVGIVLPTDIRPPILAA